MEQVRDFAATPRKGLPKRAPHMADGGVFIQREGIAPGRAHWMELIRSTTIPPETLPSERLGVSPTPESPRRDRRYFGEPMADGKWAKEAFKPSHKGRLHRALHVPEGEKIPESKMKAALHSKSSHVRHMAQAAKNI